jgi:putative 4-mercaptohistidine N1-methyltranferase
MPSSRYENDSILNEYLLFHYGSSSDQLPFEFGPQNALHFPIRCVTECLNIEALKPEAKALDLGCAVGRSSFELAKFCEVVVGMDLSHSFISAAKHLQMMGTLQYSILAEGGIPEARIAMRPENSDPKRIQFICGDALEIVKQSASFDVVLCANLICRMPDPMAFLKQLPDIINPGGQLILTSPYSWLEEFTPKNRWLGYAGTSHKSILSCINVIFDNKLQLHRAFDMPFLIREHYRKYQWGVAQASIWRKSD